MAELIAIVLVQYAWLALWLASALLTGLAVQCVILKDTLAELPWPNVELAVFFGISIGLASQIVVLIALAASNQLNSTAILIANSLLLGGSTWLVWRHPGGFRAFLASFDLPMKTWLTVLPVLLIVGAWLIRPLGPAGGSDSLTYHLPYARFYLEQGGLAVNDTLRFPLHSHNVNLLYAVALLRADPGQSASLAQMLNASMGWLSLLGIYGAARAWGGWFAAILAVSSVLLLEEFILSFGAAFVDNGAMLFITAAFLAVARWQEGIQRAGQQEKSLYLSWLWLAAICAGTAMGTKYLGAWFTVPLGLWVLWQSRSLAISLRFALLVSVFGLFWYLRAWWLVGNPVHPFAGEIFGYSIWTADDLRGQMSELASHGVDKTFLNLLLLPLKMFSESLKFTGATGNAGWLVGLFMVSCCLFPLQRHVLKPIHLTCLVYLVFWFWTSQVIRYLMIILPLMSLCTVVLWVDLASRLAAGVKTRSVNDKVIRQSSYFEGIGLGLVLVVLAYLSTQHLYRDLNWIPLTPKDKHHALMKSQASYPLAMAALDDQRIASGPILQFQLQEIRWFFPGAVIGDWMGRYPFWEFGHIGPSGHWEINSGAKLVQQMKAIGAVAVVFKKDPDIQFSPQPLEHYLDEFEIIKETDSAVLLVPRPQLLEDESAR